MRILIRSMCAAAAMLLAVVVQAKSVEVTQQASGFGDTPANAVANALVEASRQVVGISVLSDPDFRVETYEWVSSEHMASGGWTTRPEARAKSISAIAGYRVIDTVKVEDDVWKATIEARILKDQGVGPDRSALPTLAVAPFRISKDEYYPGVATPGAEVSSRLRRDVISAFAQSGRVRVVDRDFSAAVANEAEIVAGGLSPFEQAKLGKALGADLILAGEIEEFRLGRPSETFYGARLNTMEPVVRIHYRLIETSTREVLAAGTWVEKRSAGVLREQLRKADIDKDRDPDRIGEFLYPSVARSLMGVSLESLYPLRVISAPSAQSVFITQGSGRLDEGDLLSVHANVSEVTDPDSGINLRLEGPAVATLRVLSVAANYATAELISGELSVLGPQAILHVQVAAEGTPASPGKPETPGSSEAPIKW